MGRGVVAVLLTGLSLSACAAAQHLPPPVGEEPPAAVPAGIKPLTVEQEEDGAAMLRALSSPHAAPG